MEEQAEDAIWIRTGKRGRPRVRELLPEQWKEAVEAASFGLGLDAAVQYGLIEALDEDGNKLEGSGVDVRRCERVLAEGKKRGYEPEKQPY